jgi:hypothetical protein
LFRHRTALVHKLLVVTPELVSSLVECRLTLGELAVKTIKLFAQIVELLPKLFQVRSLPR